MLNVEDIIARQVKKFDLMMKNSIFWLLWHYLSFLPLFAWSEESYSCWIFIWV